MLWERLGSPHGPDLRDGSRIVAHAGAMLFIGAGVLHVSAAADHENLPVMMAGFIVVACLQVGFGALLLWRRPTTTLLLGGVTLMATSVLIWLVSRTAGLPFLPGGHMEPIGFKDGVTVLFELGSIPALLALCSRDLSAVSLPTPRLGQQAMAVLGAGMFALFTPALVLGGGEHHSADQHAAMGGHSHGEDAALADAGHGAEGHGHPGDDGEVAGATEEGHEHGEDDARATVSQEDAEGHDHAGADAGGDGDAPASDAPSGGGHDHGGGGEGGGERRAAEPQAPHEHGDTGGGEREASEPEAPHDHGGGEQPAATPEAPHDHGGGTGEPGAGHDGGDHGAGGGGGHGPEPTDPPIPAMVTQRAEALVPKPAGSRQTIKLQYGPFVLPPGTDASQFGVDLTAVEGFIVGAEPSLRYADGTAVAHGDGVHLHHAHLFRMDTGPNDSSDGYSGLEWIFGTGDEQTAGSFDAISDADPSADHRLGVPLHRGDPMAMVWMPMNMTRQPKVVFLEFKFEFVHGTAQEILDATGDRYRALTPVLIGETFNVPKTGGFYAWPRDATRVVSDALSDSELDHETFMTPEPTQGGRIEPGVGQIWTAPSDGVIVGAAGHMHEGGSGIVFSNLGSEENPCADDGDGFPGTRIFDSSAYYPPGVFPTHLKMGTTQPGWRAHVRKGDRIATNGVYDTRTYAWPDQMSVVGFYVDEGRPVSDEQRCEPELVDEPGAAPEDVTASVPYQAAERGDDGASLFHMERQLCVGMECDDPSAPPLARGPRTNTITIQDFTFTPGDLEPSGLLGGLTGTTLRGAPVVSRGQPLRFLNLDYLLLGGTRHAVTSCAGRCNGPDTMSYPNSDGLFYSGPIGYVPLAETASAENQATPTWELDTSALEPGYYTYYCWSHRWMRGAFYVE